MVGEIAMCSMKVRLTILGMPHFLRRIKLAKCTQYCPEQLEVMWRHLVTLAEDFQMYSNNIQCTLFHMFLALFPETRLRWHLEATQLCLILPTLAPMQKSLLAHVAKASLGPWCFVMPKFPWVISLGHCKVSYCHMFRSFMAADVKELSAVWCTALFLAVPREVFPRFSAADAVIRLADVDIGHPSEALIAPHRISPGQISRWENNPCPFQRHHTPNIIECALIAGKLMKSQPFIAGWFAFMALAYIPVKWSDFIAFSPPNWLHFSLPYIFTQPAISDYFIARVSGH